MYLRRETITITTTTGSSDIGYSDVVNGMLHAITYVASTSAAVSSTATLDIETATISRKLLTSLAVGSATFVKYPRAVTVVNTTNGNIAALGTTGSGTHYEPIPIVNERVKITVGASSSKDQVGLFYIDVIGG